TPQPSDGNTTITVSQSLTKTDPGPPEVGKTSTYDHTVHITNTSGTAQNLRFGAGGLFGLGRFQLAQGGTTTVSYSTQYSPDTLITSATSSSGQTQVRGSSLTWNGQLAAGESVDIKVNLSQTPTTVALNSPIRGQSLNVVDQRGQTLALAAPP